MKIVSRIFTLLILIAFVAYVVSTREIRSFGGEFLLLALYLIWLVYEFKGDEK